MYQLCIKASTHNLLHQIEFISKIFPIFHISAYVQPLGSGNIIQAFINQGTLYAIVNWFNQNIQMMPFAKHVKAIALTAKSGLLPFLQSCNSANETSPLPPQFIQSDRF